MKRTHQRGGGIVGVSLVRVCWCLAVYSELQKHTPVVAANVTINNNSAEEDESSEVTVEPSNNNYFYTSITRIPETFSNESALIRDRMAVSYQPNLSAASSKDKPTSKTEEEVSGNGSAVKPTKYHYYPHNQHIYLLPECAVQQVCNAVYVRLNYTQPLCACPSRYREPCSASLNSDDLHTTELSVDPKGKVLTLVKTCEPVADMRLCRNPRDWSLLALQNVRTGKSHYLVICRCPETSILEGPLSHDQPTYASVPGIRVYGMVCVNKAYLQQQLSSNTPSPAKRKARPMRHSRSAFQRYASTPNSSVEETEQPPAFPWVRIEEMVKYVV